MEAFRLAQKLGASGLETDAWITRDGVIVLDHDGVVGSRLRRRAIDSVDSGELPAHIPTLGQLLDFASSHDLAVSIDVKDPAAFSTVRDTVLGRSATEVRRTYLCFDNFDVLRDIAADAHSVQLVDSSRLHRIKEGPERRIATLAALGVTGLNMHQSDWNGGLVTLAHRFERLAFAWDAQFEPVLVGLLRMGIDAVYSDWVDRMVDAARTSAR